MDQKIIDGVLSRNHQLIAKAISIIENDLGNEAEQLLSNIYSKTGNAYRLGITGPPGSGKSSIVNELIKLLSLKKHIAILSVDPTSPFTGGALLGDRIRMVEHFNNSHVFIRSIGSRNSKGGLAKNINLMGDILDAAGFDIIIFETVGVGQIELDIVETADSTIVVLVPESGDDIQILKAGMMEIADIFIINKSDREGSDKINIALNNFLTILSYDKKSWFPKVIKTSVYKNFGFNKLLKAIFERHTFLDISGEREKKIQKRYIKQVEDLVLRNLEGSFWDNNKRKIVEKELSINQNKRKSPLMLIKSLFHES